MDKTICQKLWGDTAGQGSFFTVTPAIIRIMRVDLGLTFGDILLLQLMMQYCRPPNFVVWPSQTTLAGNLGADRANVAKMIGRFVTKGYIKAVAGTGRGNSNKYDMSPLRDALNKTVSVVPDLPPAGISLPTLNKDIDLDEALSRLKRVFAGQIADFEIMGKLQDLRKVYVPSLRIPNETIMDEVRDFFEKQLVDEAKQVMDQMEAEDSL